MSEGHSESMIVDHVRQLALHEQMLKEGHDRMTRIEMAIAKSDERVDAMQTALQMLIKSNSFMTRVLWGVAGAVGTIVTGAVTAFIISWIS